MIVARAGITLPERQWRNSRRKWLTGASVMLALSPPAGAEDLRRSLRDALRTNPSLAAAYADTAATGEDIVQAAVSGRPRASLTASETEFVKQTAASTITPDRTLRTDFSIGIPLYRSGAVRFGVKSAEQRYGAARQSLRGTIADLFASVVATYSDIARDAAIVRASEQNVAALQTNLRAIRGRFSIGDMTITDVALSEARLLLAEGSLRAARAQLIASRENFIRLVGRPAGDLAPLDEFRGLRTDVVSAVAEALEDNGVLRAARMSVRAADYRILSIQGERGLRVTAFSSGGYFNNLDSFASGSFFAPRENGTAAQVGIALDFPLYQGGLPASRIRQARAERGSSIEQAIALEREIVAQTRAAYAAWQLASEQLVKAQGAIVANERALKGARAENAIGTRTLLDVLDTERELFNSHVTAAAVQRDVNVASFEVLTLMGRADPEDLGLTSDGAGGSDPVGEARRSWSDWADGPSAYRPLGSTTDMLPVQDGRVDR